MIFAALVNTFFSNLIAPLQLLPEPDAGILSAISYNFGEFFGWLTPLNEFFPANTFLQALAFVIASEILIWGVNITIRIVRGA